VAIENVVNKKVEGRNPLAFCQLDLSHFKAFNDRYGLCQGNEVIQATANIVTEVVNGHADGGAIAGHIGGDDFVVITPPKVRKDMSRHHRFLRRTIRDLYDPDIQRDFVS